jgi:hypothetical protein
VASEMGGVGKEIEDDIECDKASFLNNKNDNKF